MKGIIYKVTNLQNNKIYIGQTINTLTRRRTGHYAAARANNKCYFHKALLKYAEDDFKWEILEEYENDDEALVKSFLNEKEKEYIRIFQSNNYNYGYNMTSGGDAHTEQAQQFWDDDARSGEWRQQLSKKMHDYWSDEKNCQHHAQEMKKYYASKEGSLQATRHSAFMQEYYSGPEGRLNKAKTSNWFVKAIAPDGQEFIFVSSKEPNLYFNRDISLRSMLHNIGDSWIPTKRSSVYGWKFYAIEKDESLL